MKKVDLFLITSVNSFISIITSLIITTKTHNFLKNFLSLLRDMVSLTRILKHLKKLIKLSNWKKREQPLLNTKSRISLCNHSLIKIKYLHKQVGDLAILKHIWFNNHWRGLLNLIFLWLDFGEKCLQMVKIIMLQKLNFWNHTKKIYQMIRNQ